MSAILSALAPSTFAGERDAHSDCDHTHAGCVHTDLKDDSLCWNLGSHWLDPWHHEHFRNGVPLIHNFGFEPAFLGRELFVDYSYVSVDEGSEHELEMELEWALTRRIGVVLEQGYSFVDPDGEKSVDGWGDFAVVPRLLLADCDRCIISMNLEIAAPTGSDEVGAGEEWHLAPFLTTWCDLGNWWSLTTQTGFEFAMDSEETEFFFAAGIAKAIRVFDARATAGADGHRHEVPTGILSLIAEVSGAAVVDGDPSDEGVFSLEGLVGVGLGATSSLDLRAGYLFPLNAHSELDGGVTIGAIHRF